MRPHACASESPCSESLRELSNGSVVGGDSTVLLKRDVAKAGGWRNIDAAGQKWHIRSPRGFGGQKLGSCEASSA